MKHTPSEQEYIEQVEWQLRRLLRLQDEYKEEINAAGSRMLARAIKSKAADLFVAMWPEQAKR